MKSRNVLIYFSIAFAGALAALGLQRILFTADNNGISKQPDYMVRTVSLPPDGFDFTTAADHAVHAVVHVKTIYAASENSDDFYKWFFGGDGLDNSPMESTGSGVIITTDGYIVTNNHVVEESENVEVVLNDKRSYKAKIIGTDPTTDLALLKVDATDLPTLAYGNSDDIKVGEWVLAVGNPFNLTSTVTAGIVSAKSRNINLLNNNYAIESFIQTDAAVNPGNSGGALVNIKGELIGINTAIASRTGAFAGYSFAIPVTIVRKVIDDFIEYGEVQRAFLGVQVAEIDANKATQIHADAIEGVYVEDVTSGGAAADAGLKTGDVILKIGGAIVNKVSELQEQVGKYRPGDKVLITVRRDNKLTEIEVTLRNKHGNTDVVAAINTVALGATFSDITDDDRTKYDIKHGQKIVELSAGKFMKAGVPEGFVVTHINSVEVHSFDDIQRELDRTAGGVYIEGYEPDGERGYYAFGITK